MRVGNVYDLEQCVGDRFRDFVEKDGFPVRVCHPFGHSSEFAILQKKHTERMYNNKDCVGRMLHNQYILVYSPDKKNDRDFSKDILRLHELAEKFN